MKYLLAHDLGTSGDKVTLFDENGVLVKEVTMPYPTHYFNSNWVEQNAEDWWKAVCDGTKHVTEGIDPKQICSISFSGHMSGCLCVDQEGNPLRPSMIWSDRRSEREFSELQDAVGENEIFHITGHRGAGSYTLPKLMWLKKKEPEIYEKTYKVLQCKDYIVYCLTGCFATEPTDASQTLALDIQKRKWSKKIIQAAGIALDKFPELIRSTDIAGTVTEKAAEETGLAVGTPVVIGGGDGVMGAIGTGAISKGRAFMSMGSSAWVSAVSDHPMFDAKRRNQNSPHVIDGLYLNEGVMQSAGAAFAWAKKSLGGNDWNGIEDVMGHLNQLIESSPAGANGVLFLPYLVGERCPWWDPEAKGAFLGVKMETTNADLLRAVMEGVAHNMGYIAEIIRENGVALENVIVVGGGAKSDVWKQIMADSMNVNIQMPQMLEGATSFGAAIVGGVGVGLYKDLEEAAEKFISIKTVKTPIAENVALYEEKRRIFVKAYEALYPLEKELFK